MDSTMICTPSSCLACAASDDQQPRTSHVQSTTVSRRLHVFAVCGHAYHRDCLPQGFSATRESCPRCNLAGIGTSSRSVTALPEKPPLYCLPDSHTRQQAEAITSATPLVSDSSRCPVCLENMTVAAYVKSNGYSLVGCHVRLACGHAFHTNCMLEHVQSVPPWYDGQQVKACPTCRLAIDVHSLHTQLLLPGTDSCVETAQQGDQSTVIQRATSAISRGGQSVTSEDNQRVPFLGPLPTIGQLIPTRAHLSPEVVAIVFPYGEQSGHHFG